MTRICEICGKTSQSGSKVASHSKKSSKRRFKINLHTLVTEEGKKTVCTGCLKRYRKEQKEKSRKEEKVSATRRPPDPGGSPPLR